MAGGDYAIHELRLEQGTLTNQGDYAMQLWIEASQAIEVDGGESLGGQLTGFDPAGEFRNGSIGDVFITSWERARIAGAADELIALWRHSWAGQDGVPLRVGRETWF